MEEEEEEGQEEGEEEEKEEVGGKNSSSFFLSEILMCTLQDPACAGLALPSPLLNLVCPHRGV